MRTGFKWIRTGSIVGQGPLLEFFQHDDEFSFSVKGGEFINERMAVYF